MIIRRCFLLPLVFLLACLSPATAQPRRKVIVDQDGRGPATTDQQAILLFLQSAEVETLGITIVSGDQWRDEEVAHTLRMLELTNHPDVMVYPGAIFPLINSREEMQRWEKLYGKVSYQGAWNERKPGSYHGPYEVPDLIEGNPASKAAEEDAAHFIVRMVHKYPREVTIYAGGPLTNLAQAISLDPRVPGLAQELVVMGGSMAPEVPLDWAVSNRREFNFWWDPEAAHIVLRSPWRKITVTMVDISVKARMTKTLIEQIGRAGTPAAQYIAKYAEEGYLWDELAAAAWLDPSIITKQIQVYLDVDISHGASYGNTLTWMPGGQPNLGEQVVTVNSGLNLEKFQKILSDLLSRSSHSGGRSRP